MIISFGIKHNAICIFEGFQPSDGDPLALLRQERPNAFSAMDGFLKEWDRTVLGEFAIEALGVTILFDHCEGFAAGGKKKLAKTKSGYSAAFDMTYDELMIGHKEREVSEIQSSLGEKMREILQRPSFATVK